MSTDITLKVTEIQRFCMHDGPGIRTTVFLKGCPLSCAWCHNPETQSSRPQLLYYQSKCIGCTACLHTCPSSAHSFEKEHIIDRAKCTSCSLCADICPTGALEICGRDMTLSSIISAIEKDSAFYGGNGGVTLSGGEPLIHGAAVDLLKECKARGLSTAIETCGHVNPDILKQAIPFADLFLWDIKDTDEKRHKLFTGVSNDLILSNLDLANSLNAKIRLRCIIINGINTAKEHYEGIADIASAIKNLDGVELIPYHAYGGTKATFIGRADNGKSEWIPEQWQTDEAKTVLIDRGIRVL